MRGPSATTDAQGTELWELSLAESLCVGDCNGLNGVAINELITLVNIALGKALPSACPHGIPSGAKVNIALLIQAVNATLRGCGHQQANRLADLTVPGFDFHALKGAPRRYSLHINGPWCITFEWVDGDAWRVDLEQYH